MGNKWRSNCLDSLNLIFEDGDRSARYPKSKEFLDCGNHPFLNTKNIIDGQLDLSEVNFISDDKFNEIKKGRVDCGDIIISTRGSKLGKVAFYRNHKWQQPLINAQLLIIKNQDDSIDSEFLYYLLNSVEGQRQIDTLKSGSAQPQLPVRDLKKFVIRYPEISYQKRIVAIASKLDKKITLNRQINQTLEQMAQTLFKSCFVDFDPVIDNALDAGNPIPDELQARAELRKTVRESENFKPLPDNIRQLFPSEFEESELGWVPKGWMSKPIKEHCSKVQNGGTPKRSNQEFWEGGNVPWLTSGEVRQSIITNVENRITELGLKNSSAKWVAQRSTLVALYGATAGEVSINAEPLTTNQAVCALIPKPNYCWLNYLQISNKTKEMQSKAVGSAQQNISKGLVESLLVISPPSQVLDCFHNFVDGYFQRAIANQKANQVLVKLRDTLLPKLISGELRLEEAETELEQAVTA